VESRAIAGKPIARPGYTIISLDAGTDLGVSSTPFSKLGVGLAIVEQSAVERLAMLLEREIALEAAARELTQGTQLDKLLAELEELRALIKMLKPE
jgi:hypothetical protein